MDYNIFGLNPIYLIGIGCVIIAVLAFFEHTSKKRLKKIPKHSIAIIGMGSVGSALAYTLCTLHKNLIIYMHDTINNRVKGEIADMLPIASSRNIVLIDDFPSDADVYVVTAGIKRHPNQNKDDLYSTNRLIIADIMEKIDGKPTIIVTNPPNRLASEHKNATPFGLSLDNMRARALGFNEKIIGSHENPACKNPEVINKIKELNNEILIYKGYTQWGPAYALALFVLNFDPNKNEYTREPLHDFIDNIKYAKKVLLG